jgi:serralysin
VVAGEFGGWTPIGVEQTSSGYEVAFKIPGANEYTIWTTDSSGNYISDDSTQSGTSLAIETAETLFHQDLNGDGVIGIPSTVIEADGSTSLVETGNNFFLDSISSGSGPELKYGGAPVVAGEFGGWTPIGAEQTSTGYEVAFKVPGANEYTIWTTDSNGNYISDDSTQSGTSLAIESAETFFHQDLNGDGVIGMPSTVIEADGSTSLVEAGNVFFLDSISNGSGPELKYGGAPVVAGEFGGWTPIGAEQTSSGYEVAFKVSGANEYTIWTTDSNGNYISDDGTVGNEPCDGVGRDRFPPGPERRRRHRPHRHHGDRGGRIHQPG